MSGSESSSHEFAWAVRQAIEERAIEDAGYVVPNGGHASGCRDWDGGSVRADTWIIKEFMPHIESAYRTIKFRRGRALCGALWFLAKHLDRFCLCVS